MSSRNKKPQVHFLRTVSPHLSDISKSLLVMIKYDFRVLMSHFLTLHFQQRQLTSEEMKDAAEQLRASIAAAKDKSRPQVLTDQNNYKYYTVHNTVKTRRKSAAKWLNHWGYL